MGVQILGGRGRAAGPENGYRPGAFSGEQQPRGSGAERPAGHVAGGGLCPRCLSFIASAITALVLRSHLSRQPALDGIQNFGGAFLQRFPIRAALHVALAVLVGIVQSRDVVNFAGPATPVNPFDVALFAFLADFALFGKIDLGWHGPNGADNKPLASMPSPVYTGFFRR